MLTWALNAALWLLALSLVLCFVRLALGPGLPDRILALDTLYVNAIAFLVVFGIRTSSGHYFEAALLIALFGFAATVAFAAYLLRGNVLE